MIIAYAISFLYVCFRCYSARKLDTKLDLVVALPAFSFPETEENGLWWVCLCSFMKTTKGNTTVVSGLKSSNGSAECAAEIIRYIFANWELTVRFMFFNSFSFLELPGWVSCGSLGRQQEQWCFVRRSEAKTVDAIMTTALVLVSIKSRHYNMKYSNNFDYSPFLLLFLRSPFFLFAELGVARTTFWSRLIPFHFL